MLKPKENTKPGSQYWILVIASPLLIFILWLVVSKFGWVRPILLPTPAEVAASFSNMLMNGYSGVSLFNHLLASLNRVGMAFLFGSVSGIAIGMLRGRISNVDAIFLVPGEMLRPIPPLGLIPLFILWFGIGELSKVLLIFTSVFLVMMVSAQAGTRSCQADAIRAAQTCGASRYQIFRFVVFPSALPQIMTGLRVALGTALSILVASELLGGDRGLGFIVLDAANFFRTAYVFSGIIVIGIVGFISDRILVYAGRRIVHWEGRR
ncbi:ABC transporter permease [Brenneria populi subsp. brevivirga]|uniref:ABC transporter permease n=1 Tax=Brenneria populi TaxID=1505588 RepID=UPI002E17653B|nr:ABC transporter permease [Brenneria populi subsp. brevivirga]